MQKTIDINGRKVNFKKHGAITILYAQQYGKDFFSTIMQMETMINSGDGGGDLMPVYQLAHLFARTADKESTPENLVDWLASFEDGFPVIDVFVELQDLILSNMQSLKKK